MILQFQGGKQAEWHEFLLLPMTPPAVDKLSTGGKL